MHGHKSMPNQKILLDCYYPINTLDARRAEEMFCSFIKNGFLYDTLSNNPDSLVYPSPYTLSIILPNLIDSMLKNNDTINFLIYGILTAIDPDGDGNVLFSNRCHAIKKILKTETVANICRLLNRIEHDPPIESRRLKRIKEYWGC